MKKIFNMLFLLPMLLLAGACSQEELAFDHEQPAFEVKDGMILLEVIMPTTTAGSDEIFISGAFNGGDAAEITDPMWKLEKATTIERKWGIYLDPATFVEGKTLADGYKFISTTNGEERTVLNKEVVRTENPEPGTRTNLYVSQWASFFESAGLPKHGGVRIYVEDKTGWSELRLYQYGDENDLGGSWPGAEPTGSTTIADVEYTYFEYAIDAVAGKNQHLIFNNNDGKQIPGDQEPVISFSADVTDYFYTIDANMKVTVIEDPLNRETEIPNVKLYITDNTGWEDLLVFGTEGGAPSVFGDFPGTYITETEEIDGKTYKVLEVSSVFYGKALNLMFNDNRNSFLNDLDVVLDRDYYITLTPEKAKDDYVKTIYIQNMNDEWTNFGMVAVEGSNKITSDYPGYVFKEEDKVTVDGNEYYAYEIPADNYEKDVTITFNNTISKESSTAALKLKMDEDRFVEIHPDGAGVPGSKPTTVYISNDLEWTDFALYAWGDAEAFGAWPGVKSEETVEKDGKTFHVYNVSRAHYNMTLNLIFNGKSGENGVQTGDYKITTDKDYYLVNGVDEEKNILYDFSLGMPKEVKVHIENRNGWESPALYAYGDVENVFGAWPGAAPAEETATVDGVEYLVFTASKEAFAKNLNLIFNGKSGVDEDGNPVGVQTADYPIVLTEDVYLIAYGTNLYADEADVPKELKETKIYVENRTEWTDFALYCWDADDNRLLGDWPGTKTTVTETVDGVLYNVYTVAKEHDGKEATIIFNNNNNGSQLSNYPITCGQDYYLIAHSTGMYDDESKIPTGPRMLYFKPAIWDNASATERFEAYFYGSGDTWVTLEKDGDVYKCEIPDGMSTVIFVRMDASKPEHNWDSKWNQTVDIPIPTDNNCYTINTWNASGDKSGGEWSKI